MNGDYYLTVDDLLWFFYISDCRQDTECEHPYENRYPGFDILNDDKIDYLDTEEYIKRVLPVGITSETTSYYYLEWQNVVRDSLPIFNDSVMDIANRHLDFVEDNNPDYQSYLRLIRNTIGDGHSTGHYALSADFHNSDIYPPGVVNLYDLREYFILLHGYLNGRSVTDSSFSRMDYNFDGKLDIRDIEPAVHYFASHSDGSQFLLTKWGEFEEARLFAKRWCGYYKTVNSTGFNSIYERFGFNRDSQNHIPLACDMNSDSLININDAMAFFGYASDDSGQQSEKLLSHFQSDLNYDGEITGEDAELYLYCLLHTAFEHLPRFFQEPREQQKQDFFYPAITAKLDFKAKTLADETISNLIASDSGWAEDLNLLKDRLAESWSEQSVLYDFNGDGYYNILDAISLIIHQRDNPDSLLGDINRDGKYDINDVIELIIFSHRDGI